MKLVPSFLAVLLLVSGCAHYPRNARLTGSEPATGYRFRPPASPRGINNGDTDPQSGQNIPRGEPTNSSDLLLMLAFSGGGTRAAALSYGVLEQLARTPLGVAGTQHRMLDEVDIISSVSGGSFTAAYYALWGDRIFSDFESRFLKKNVQTALMLRVLSPWNQVRLASPKFGRSDLATEYYDHLLFQGATFAELSADRPFLCINATDTVSGARFEFTQDEFDLIGSDVSQFPIARAVAASSAVPLLLTPVVLRNYSAEQTQPEPEWIRSILADPASPPRVRYVASHARSYLEGHRRFIHLLDGGISDNLGLRAALDRIIAREQSAPIPSAPWKLPCRVAIIIVDAHTERDYGLDTKELSLGLKTLLGSVSGAVVRHYSFETIELVREVMARLARERTGAGDSRSEAVVPYVIELHFNQLADPSDRRFFNSVPTTFALPSKTVDRLRQLAARELADNAEFRRLVSDLGGQPDATNLPARLSPATTK
ncbi:MAG: patatin-like phospholipase family protein [Verrucomicrobia bacterium]|nr:patatin-like phospholipase family protein [Verrucomicrobiota bacterium]